MNHEWLDRLIGFCSPKSLPAPWDRYCDRVPFFRCPDKPEMVLDNLLELTDAESLIKEGIIRDEGGLVLAPELSDPADAFVVTTGRRNRCYILTQSGLLGGKITTLSVSEGRVRRHCLQPRSIFVTSCLDDLVALRSLNFEACLPDGLLHCDDRQLTWFAPIDRLRQRLAIGPERLLSAKIEEGRLSLRLPIKQDILNEMTQYNFPNLILVDWYPAMMSRQRPMQLGKLISWMFDGFRFRDRDVSRIVVWKPSQLELKRIRFCLEADDFSAVREAINDSVEDSGLTVQAFMSRKKTKQPANFIEAWTATRPMLSGGPEEVSQIEVDRAIAVLDQLHDRDIVQPLMNTASETPDPIRRIQLMAMSDLVRLAHKNSLALEKKLAGAKTQWDSGIDKLLKQQVDIQTAILRHCGEMSQ